MYCKKKKNLDVIEGQHPEEEYSSEEIKESGAEFDEEKTSESDIEKVPSCLPSYPPSFQEDNKKRKEDLNFMVE